VGEIDRERGREIKRGAKERGAPSGTKD